MAAPPPSASDLLTPVQAGGDDVLVAGAARFATDLAIASGREPRDDLLLALAVSGGPDSMAMLALAHRARPGRVVAATFDHGLRTGSAAEAAMVAAWCANHDIPHMTLHPDAPLPVANVQAAARMARYAALTRWATAAGAGVLATAHHADDQAETFLMRANRGSGPSGLAGIRVRRSLAEGVMLVRPLLGWRRHELAAVIATGVPAVDDPSNRNPRFDRVRLRTMLAGQTVLDPARIARTAAYVAETEADLAAMRDWAWGLRRRAGAEVALDMADLPRTLRRMLVRTAIDRVRDDHGIALPAFSDSSNVEAMIDALESGRGATHGGVMATARAAIWTFRPAPPRKAS